MNACGKSNNFVVPTTQVNKAAPAVAEFAEERRSPKGVLSICRRCFGHRAEL